MSETWDEKEKSSNLIVDTDGSNGVQMYQITPKSLKGFFFSINKPCLTPRVVVYFLLELGIGKELSDRILWLRLMIYSKTTSPALHIVNYYYLTLQDLS